jgi:hypothetical protein
MAKRKTAYGAFVEKHEEKWPLGKSACKLNDNAEMNIREVGQNRME